MSDIHTKQPKPVDVDKTCTLEQRIAKYLADSPEVTMHDMHPNVLLAEAKEALIAKDVELAMLREMLENAAGLISWHKQRGFEYLIRG